MSVEHAHTRHLSWVPVALLTLLCLATYFPGLDSHGITNWQEGQRLLVARDMQSRGDWLVPTVHGQPYIAKPPMIYWAQLSLAKAMGHTIELWHLRLVAAIAGLLGVLAAFGAAKELLTPDLASVEDHRFATSAAFWSAALLATGILYVRAARIGELDILLVPFIAAAVWAVARAFRTHRLARRTNWLAVLAATLASTGAVLTKDPGLLYVAFAAYGGIAAWYAFSRDPLDLALLPSRVKAPLVLAPNDAPWVSVLGAILGGLAFGVPAAMNVRSAGDSPGPIIIGIAGALVGTTVSRLLHPRRLRACLVALSRTHPVLVIGVPAAVRLTWGWLVAQRVGADVVARLSRAEADDNVRLFVPQAPINNLETMLFGLGLGSVLAVVAVAVLLRWRPRLTPGAAMLAAWIILNFIAFSMLGKGVQRYLTPMWPAWAILAGWAAATWCRPRPLRVSPAPWLAAAIILLGGAQSFQYGWLRDALNAKRSPRDLVRAITDRPDWRDASALFSFEYTTPALDYYAGGPVRVVGDPRALATMYAGDPWTLDQFREHLHASGESVIIYRDGPIPGTTLPPAIDRLRDAGFVVESLGSLPAFEIDNGRTPMKAARVKVQSGSGAT